MKRIGAALFAVGLLLLFAVPAQAANTHVEWTTPTANGTVAANAFTFSARVHASSGTLTNTITVAFSSPAGRPVPNGFSRTPGSVANYPVTEPVSFPWNGSYGVSVTASAKNGVLDNDTAPRTTSTTFTVDAPPATPANVRATVDSKTRVVTVSWNPNTEPDLAGYQVVKQSSSGTWNFFAATTGTSVVDESTANKGGTYRYQVQALRQSAQAGSLNSSAYSPPAGATVAAPPAQTTPTTTKPAGTGGGDSTTGSTGGSGSSGSSGGSVGGSGTSAEGETVGPNGERRSGATNLATSGKVDLSDFASLLEQSRSTGGATTADGEEPGEDDGTFGDTLPFKARTGGNDGDEESEESLGETPASEGNNPEALGFLAGGLLATVLAMHVLWIRSEVHRAEALEALIPVEVVEAPPAGRRRRRPSPAAR